MTQEKSCCTPQTDGYGCGNTPATEPCASPKELDKEQCCPPTPDNVQSCCSPASVQQSCCPPKKERRIAGYRLEDFVKDWLETPAGEVPVVARKLNTADHLGHFAMRWGFGRNQYLVTPGLYAIGKPDTHSEVLVSANYKLSFDLLRSSLQKIDAWILVIDTKGVNVWCAAGKGTFGTNEIIRCVKTFELDRLVGHKRLIVPQLGAPGVSTHLVKKSCGFSVVYGPVRATDLPAFFAANRQATPTMRRVMFTLRDRTILTPVEITILSRQILYVALALFILGGVGSHIFSFSAATTRGGGAIIAGFAGLIAGSVITPILLPWLPGRAFSLKGVWPGLAMAIIIGGNIFGDIGNLNQVALLLEITAISSYTAMNFTGSSTYTSPSGVEKEMRRAIPCQLIASVGALILWLWTAF